MQTLPLSVKRGIFRADDPHSEKHNAAFAAVRKNILRRDKYTCQSCGWQCKEYQEVHHIDNDHANNATDNLICLCPLCHGACHVGFQGISGRAKLCHLPYITADNMAAWHDMQRTFWILHDASANTLDTADDWGWLDDWRNNTSALFNQLLSWGQANAERILGHSDAAHFGWQLSHLSDEDYARRGHVLEGFCLFYRRDAFDTQMTAWKAAKAFAKNPIESCLTKTSAYLADAFSDLSVSDALKQVSGKQVRQTK